MDPDIYAFIDEHGNTDVQTDKDGASDLFVITAVLVSAADLARTRIEAEAIRRRFFQTGELKSSRIGRKRQNRRLRILQELATLPIHTAQIAVNKRAVYKNSGLAYKRSFFKNINARLYRVLSRGFPNLAVFADEHGSHEFMDGFKKYIEREIPMDLFQRRTVQFVSSESDVLVQVADMLAGSLAHCLDGHYADDIRPAILEILHGKALWLTTWPPVLRSEPPYSATTSAAADEFVRDYCLRQAAHYLTQYDDTSLSDHTALLDYLYFVAEFLDDAFVPTARLRQQLAQSGSDAATEPRIREIVRDLRDSGVIIASGPTGYKVPTAVRDVHSFVAHANLIVPPMLKRLARARQDIRLASKGEIDILYPDEFGELRGLVDKLGEMLLARTEGDLSEQL